MLAGFAASGAFLALTVLSPLLAPEGAFRHLDGTPTLIDGGWRGNGAAGIMYAIGDVLCHQEEARSLMLNGSQLPICARDTGIVIGLCAGFAACYLLGRRLSDRRYAVLGAVLVLVMAAEWCYETTGFDSQPLRLLTGISAGIGASLFLSWSLYRSDEWDA